MVSTYHTLRTLKRLLEAKDGERFATVHLRLEAALDPLVCDRLATKKPSLHEGPTSEGGYDGTDADGDRRGHTVTNEFESTRTWMSD
jgi:hypothetical protein